MELQRWDRRAGPIWAAVSTRRSEKQTHLSVVYSTCGNMAYKAWPFLFRSTQTFYVFILSLSPAPNLSDCHRLDFLLHVDVWKVFILVIQKKLFCIKSSWQLILASLWERKKKKSQGSAPATFELLQHYSFIRSKAASTKILLWKYFESLRPGLPEMLVHVTHSHKHVKRSDRSHLFSDPLSRGY